MSKKHNQVSPAERDEIVRRLLQRHDDSTLTVEEVALWFRKTPAWVRAHSSGRRRPNLPTLRKPHEKEHSYFLGELKAWRKNPQHNAA